MESSETTNAARFASWRDHIVWAVLALAACASVVMYKRGLSRVAFLATGQWWLGVAAAALLLTGHLYSARKRLGLGRFRPLRPWYVAHLWLSGSGVIAAVLHAGGAWGGIVECFLLVSFVLAFVSGCLLAVLHDRFQRWMIALEDEHLLPEDIVDQRGQRATEVAELLAANRPELRHAADQRIFRPLTVPQASLACLRGRAGVTAVAERLTQGLEPALPAFSGEEQNVLRRILTVAVERKKLAVQHGLHRVRTAWVTAHIILTTLAGALLALHVALVWYY